MNDPAGIASTAGTLLPPISTRRCGSIEPAWEPSNKRLSMKDSVAAGAFLLFYLAAYAAAGYAGIVFVEWAWMRVFG